MTYPSKSPGQSHSVRSPTAPWHLAALALVTTGLVACGPSGPNPADVATAAPTAAVPVAPAAPAPDEVKPPPTSTVPSPTPRVPMEPRVAAVKPPPIETPPGTMPPRQVAQAKPQVAVREVVPAGQYGRVSSIQTLRSEAHTNGSGAVIGGVLGGVLGHQIGSGNGRTAATAIGAVGGAVAGNNIEKNRSREVIGYRVTVQLDNGHSRSVTVNSLDGLSRGDRVRYADGHLYRA